MKRRDLLAFLLVALVSPATAAAPLSDGLAAFADGHAERLGDVDFVNGPVSGCGEAWHVETDVLARPATGPLVLDHGEPREHAVVLIHGLSDSPFFMCGLARAFFTAGANVVLPLLSGHGLAEPLPDAHAPELAERWKAEGEAALAFARTRGARVSAGGFSTGGVLAVWLRTHRPEQVDGGVMLFSAAFDFATKLRLAARCSGSPEARARNPLRRWCHAALVRFAQAADRYGPWRGRNPYRTRLSEYGALQLGLLRRATLDALARRPLDAPLFVAHSLHDRTAPITGIERLTAMHAAPGRIERFLIDDSRAENCRTLESDCVNAARTTPPCGLPHAGVVLATPIRPDGAAAGSICEVANPRFDEMAARAVAFLRRLP
ncbi:MAG: hypothetical protein GVY33_04655 [Alphaproteobacteria bacterium]|nr:hypothetical protein [Alphaproteobacteria bacterium]